MNDKILISTWGNITVKLYDVKCKFLDEGNYHEAHQKRHDIISTWFSTLNEFADIKASEN